MKLIIDIPEEDYKFIKDLQSLIIGGRGNGRTIQKNVINAIANGTPYEERPKGKWIFDKEHSITIDMFKCSVCGGGGHTHFNYCPNCGAQMER